jgi:hypothetical protein
MIADELVGYFIAHHDRHLQEDQGYGPCSEQDQLSCFEVKGPLNQGNSSRRTRRRTRRR